LPFSFDHCVVRPTLYIFSVTDKRRCSGYHLFVSTKSLKTPKGNQRL